MKLRREKFELQIELESEKQDLSEPHIGFTGRYSLRGRRNRGRERGAREARKMRRIGERGEGRKAYFILTNSSVP